jgi:hypothetical protein
MLVLCLAGLVIDSPMASRLVCRNKVSYLEVSDVAYVILTSRMVVHVLLQTHCRHGAMTLGAYYKQGVPAASVCSHVAYCVIVLLSFFWVAKVGMLAYT